MKFLTILIIVLTLLFSIYETYGVWHAYLSNKTKAKGRLIRHIVMTIFLILLLIIVIIFGTKVLLLEKYM
jgi:heme/copper-type cytochrome/quinol oxidase subunit 2